MEKYYSSVLTPSGLLCYFKVLCAKHPKAKFYIINDGTDFERAIFFDELNKKLRGFNLTQFFPFFDEALNGIYIKNLDTFILADSVFSKACPLSLGLCEKAISLSRPIKITSSEKTEISKHFLEEKNNYQKAVSLLRLASCCKENRNALFSDYLSDDRAINAIGRILKKIPLGVKKGKPEVKFYSALTPLGIHTQWDTIFRNFDTVIELQDNDAFSSAIIIGVIRDRLISGHEEFTLSPSLFHRTIPQIITIPQSGVAIIRADENHILPFAPTHRINTEKFVSLPKAVKNKAELLKEAENNYLENAVTCIYEGFDNRQKRNKILLPYCNIQNAKETAENIFNEITA